MTHLRPVAIPLAALFLLAAGAAEPEKKAKVGTFRTEKILVKETEREYRLVVPQAAGGDKPVPLVFAFHGLGDSKDLMAFYTQLGRLAKKEGFILVFPNGRGRMWPLLPIIAGDDFAFFDALYDHLSETYHVDQKRVYLTGMSNGAYFINLLASVRSEKIAAIAPHSGGPGVLAKGVKAKHKYAVLVIHGADDRIVKVEEGQKTAAVYKKAGHKVKYVEVEKWGHLWAHKAKVNEKMWEFFEAHPQP